MGHIPTGYPKIGVDNPLELVYHSTVTPLHRRILELSYHHRLSHIGSCLGCVDIIDEVYKMRKPDEPFILSNGHAFAALAVVLEKHLGKDADDLIKRHGVHPTKNLDDGVYCSTGALGAGVTVAIGRALANPKRRVWVLISDGEIAEGAVYEALTFAYRANLTNLRVRLFANGYGAYRAIDLNETVRLFRAMCPDGMVYVKTPEQLGIPFLASQSAHYYVQTDADWAWVQQQEVI